MNNWFRSYSDYCVPGSFLLILEQVIYILKTDNPGTISVYLASQPSHFVGNRFGSSAPTIESKHRWRSTKDKTITWSKREINCLHRRRLISPRTRKSGGNAGNCSTKNSINIVESQGEKCKASSRFNGILYVQPASYTDKPTRWTETGTEGVLRRSTSEDDFVTKNLGPFEY